VVRRVVESFPREEELMLDEVVLVELKGLFDFAETEVDEVLL
jgi:hypothetical protein